MGIGDWGLGPIPNPQSPIPNPQSPKNLMPYNIGLLQNIDQLVNQTIKSNNTDYYSTKNYNTNNLKSALNLLIYKWRRVGGDGNCFYRAVMFSYVEKILLNKDFNKLKALLLDMDEVFNSSNGNSNSNTNVNQALAIFKKSNPNAIIKLELSVKILYLLYSILKDNDYNEKNNNNTDNNTNSLYILLIKCFNGDWGLGIGDWGLGPIPNPQSPIPNPQIHIIPI